MPRESGDVLFLDIRSHENHKDIPFLMLTFYSGRDSLITAIQAGVADHVIKAFTPVLLLSKIHKLLG